MEKSATLNLRVNPVTKQRAEAVLAQLGVPMSTAVDMYLNQIYLTGGIPFSVSLPKAPASVDAAQMSDEQIHAKLQAGINNSEEAVDAADAFAAFRESIR